MSDFNVRFIADSLGKSVEKASEKVVAELNQAVKNLAHAAHASVIAHVQGSRMAQSNRRDYLKGLNFDQIGDNSYLISLDGEWPNKLEEGFPAYDMRQVLLASQKVVGVGPRAGQPWVRLNKDGGKYAAVPFEHRPHAGKPTDLAAQIKNLFAMNRQGVVQEMSKTFTDDFGKPLAGKVATVLPGAEVPKNLENLAKYQHVSKSGRVSSLYVTYRMVSEDGKGWQHPGHPGNHIFKKVEAELQKELENIIRVLL